MDKEEFRIKLEEINHLVEKKDYEGAMNIVDSIDWRRVKNIRTLCVVGEIYAANKRYEDSRDIFELASHRASIGKNILYRLVEVSLKMDDVEGAMDYFEEFKEVAPNDNNKYILKYKIYSAKGASLNDQIKILEEYKEREFTEKWAYELAKLYYRAGDKEKCLNLCNEMVLWFSEGSYVMKALDLKMRMGVLTGQEKEKYEQQFIPKLLTPEDAKAIKENSENGELPQKEDISTEEKETPQIESIQIRNDRDLSGTETIQDKISKGIRDIFGTKKKEEDEISNEEEGTEKEEIHEEMIKKPVSKDEFLNVPSLEKEGEKPAAQEDLSSGLKMPELNIPESMIKPKITVPSFIMGSMDEITASSEEQKEETAAEENLEKPSMDFNLEDTILAAASAQGIDLSEKEPEDIKEAEEDAFEEEEEEVFSELLNENIQEEAQEEPSLEEIKLDLTEEEELEQFIESIQPKEERDALDIVPRSNDFTEEEKKLFTYFVKIPGMKEQIIETLTDVQNAASDSTSKTGNIIVMGGKETGKTRLIGSLIPAICRELNLEAAKVAYVFAEQINGKNIFEITEKLAGGFFVIENANQLSQDTAEQLEAAMDGNTNGMIVIVEDEKIGMRKFIARFPKLAKKFTSTLNIPAFTNDELVMFAKVYTKENGYKIDQMGMLELYNQIGLNQKEDEPMTIGAVKEMIDSAIAKSQSGIRKFKRNISKKHTDREGYIMLYEKDFIK